MCNVNDRTIQRRPSFRTIGNRINFAMNNGLFMIVLNPTDVRRARNVSVVSHRNDMIIFDDDRPDF